MLNAFAAMSIPDSSSRTGFWPFSRSATDRGNQCATGDIIWDLVSRYERSRQAA